MERRIIELTTNSGETVYAVDGLIEGHDPELMVKSILFKRDGLIGVNNGAIDEAQYIVTLVNEPSKQLFYISVPERTVHTVSFVEVVEKKDDNEVEVEKVS